MSDREKDSGAAIAKLGNKNAKVHGIYMKDIQFPWECDREFTAMHRQLKKEFVPTGRAEREEVLALAIQYYHKHTIYRIWHCEILRFPVIKELMAVGGKSWPEVRQSLLKCGEMDYANTTLGDLVETLKRQMIKTSRTIRNNLDSEAVGELNTQLQAFAALLTGTVLPLYRELYGLDDVDPHERPYGLAALERIIKLESMIDARIQKTLGRLVGLKEFKRTPAGQEMIEQSN